MTRLAVLLAIAGACAKPQSVSCGDFVCAPGQVCAPGGHGCAFQEAVSSCTGALEDAACSYRNVPDGICHGGVCVSISCGDNVKDPTELCDDGNTVSGDGCSWDCQSAETCGNGIVDVAAGEQCDLGAANADVANSSCRAMCKLRGCGDGIVDFGEQCDDGNTSSGDGCDQNCTKTSCGNGIQSVAEECELDTAVTSTCQDFGFTDGNAPTCGSTCLVDGSACHDHYVALTASRNVDGSAPSIFYEHACALRDDGSFECWGANDFQQARSDYFSTVTVAAVSAGGQYTCGISAADGAVVCKGLGTAAMPPAGAFTAIAAGTLFSCGIKDDQTLACWGDNASGQTNAPSGTYTSLAAGWSHACAVATDGSIACWGDNTQGQATAPTGTFSAVAAGWQHSCGLHTDGTLVCWGATSGVTPSGTFAQIAAGDAYSCALASNGALTCWGTGSFGVIPTPPAGTYAAVAVGFTFACALRTDNSVICWGSDNAGQAKAPAGTYEKIEAGGYYYCGLSTAGTITCTQVGTGTGLPPGGVFRDLSTGWNGIAYGCAIGWDGQVQCWGSNTDGMLDAPAGTFTQLSSSNYFSCAVRSDRDVICWGRSTDGQTLAPAGPFERIAAGGRHACGIRPDGTVACWGANDSGQATPSTGAFAAIDAGLDFTCGLHVDGSLACWGDSANGKTAPPSGVFVALSCGYDFSCAIRADGTAVCWGLAFYGIPAPPNVTFRAISAGENLVCGVTTDRRGVCWGREARGL